ncbi:uncharacterized protein LOC128165096 [Crassostrea angulata]|uniref:uncharacterized protein LOC128165096 n=1 Tax=Magallana angulata TaxID=2784310 RepID=UPI0022B0D02E|nr:uncharacterized protein LOC128165096 [Crassostrea angulata]
MNSLFRTSFLFLLTFIKVSSHEQFHGFFKSIGFMNDPELAFALNKIYNKSRPQCSSECLKHESCYYFDFCKIGSSSSCYIYNNTVADTFAVVSGACKRFGLKQTCDAEYTSPCRCPTNMGDERCNYNYDCSGNLVDWSTPSHKFYKTFSNNIEKEMWCEMNIDNGGWIVKTITLLNNCLCT